MSSRSLMLSRNSSWSWTTRLCNLCRRVSIREGERQRRKRKWSHNKIWLKIFWSRRCSTKTQETSTRPRWQKTGRQTRQIKAQDPHLLKERQAFRTKAQDLLPFKARLILTTINLFIRLLGIPNWSQWYKFWKIPDETQLLQKSLNSKGVLSGATCHRNHYQAGKRWRGLFTTTQNSWSNSKTKLIKRIVKRTRIEKAATSPIMKMSIWWGSFLKPRTSMSQWMGIRWKGMIKNMRGKFRRVTRESRGRNKWVKLKLIWRYLLKWIKERKSRICKTKIVWMEVWFKVSHLCRRT